MIILGKNFSTYDNYINIKPIAQIKDKQIVLIDKENKSEMFPNSGKIYTPNPLQKLTPGNFAIYKLEPSLTYDRENEGSHYYSVKELKSTENLIEVFYMEESFRDDVDKIAKKVQNGFLNKVESLKYIILCTSDGYILGPFKVDYDAESKQLKIINNFEGEKYILPVYDNSSASLNIISYYDKHDDIDRNFTIDYPSEKNKVDELDIASNDYIVYEAIRTLKGQEEFGDITRRVLQEIKGWLENTTFSEKYNLKRLKKTVELIEEVSMDEEDSNYNKYKKSLLSLPSVQDLIEQKKEEKFKVEYEVFLKKHDNLISKNKELNRNNLKLTETLHEHQKNLRQIKENINKYKDFMNQKKEMMEKDILDYYFHQLITNNLSFDGPRQTSYTCNKESEESYQIYESIRELKKAFKFNLKQYEERDSNNEILDYCLLTLKFNQPLIIVGEASLKLARIIQKTFSASGYQTIIPETEHFNLNFLNDIKSKKNDALSFTSIHNIQVSSASLNLSAFFNEYESENSNNKMIFTFDSFKEGQFILEQLEFYSILDVEKRAFFPSPFGTKESIKLGQTSFDILIEDFQPLLTYEDSLGELLEVLVEDNLIEREEEIKRLLKNPYKRLIHTNQFLGKATKALNYFPFLNINLEDDKND